MGRIIISTNKQLFLHIVQSYIDTSYTKKFSLCIPNRRDNTNHHNIFSHQFIYIRVHNIWCACLFNLHIIFFFIIVKGIFMLFKKIACFLLIWIYNCFISNVSSMNTIRFSIGICNHIFFKISKRCWKSITTF